MLVEIVQGKLGESQERRALREERGDRGDSSAVLGFWILRTRGAAVRRPYAEVVTDCWEADREGFLNARISVRNDGLLFFRGVERTEDPAFADSEWAQRNGEQSRSLAALGMTFIFWGWRRLADLKFGHYMNPRCRPEGAALQTQDSPKTAPRHRQECLCRWETQDRHAAAACGAPWGRETRDAGVKPALRDPQECLCHREVAGMGRGGAAPLRGDRGLLRGKMR